MPVCVLYTSSIILAPGERREGVWRRESIIVAQSWNFTAIYQAVNERISTPSPK